MIFTTNMPAAVKRKEQDLRPALNKFSIGVALFAHFFNHMTNATVRHLHMQHRSKCSRNICHMCFPIGFSGLDIPSVK